MSLAEKNLKMSAYNCLVDETMKIVDAIEKYNKWDKTKIIGDKSKNYTIENHLEYLESKKAVLIKAMEILDKNGMGF